MWPVYAFNYAPMLLFIVSDSHSPFLASKIYEASVDIVRLPFGLSSVPSERCELYQILTWTFVKFGRFYRLLRCIAFFGSTVLFHVFFFSMKSVHLRNVVLNINSKFIENFKRSWFGKTDNAPLRFWIWNEIGVCCWIQVIAPHSNAQTHRETHSIHRKIKTRPSRICADCTVHHRNYPHLQCAVKFGPTMNHHLHLKLKTTTGVTCSHCNMNDTKLFRASMRRSGRKSITYIDWLSHIGWLVARHL